MSASISKEYFGADTTRPTSSTHISALRTALDYYTYLSPEYEFSRSIPSGWDKGTQKLGLVSVPSIFYGSTIRRGTVSLKFFITGTLVGELHDEAKNGELVQVGPTGSNGSGSVGGVILYDEGEILLTGSWDITADGTALGPSHTEDYGGPDNPNDTPQWTYFANGMAGLGIEAPNSSFQMSFQGTNRIPTMMLLAHAPKSELNHSNNRSFIKYSPTSQYASPQTGSSKYVEGDEIAVKNIASSSYLGYEESFEKITYISKIAIYDEDKRLIGIAKLANPVKKAENRDFTFKLKLDI